MHRHLRLPALLTALLLLGLVLAAAAFGSSLGLGSSTVSARPSPASTTSTAGSQGEAAGTSSAPSTTTTGSSSPAAAARPTATKPAPKAKRAKASAAPRRQATRRSAAKHNPATVSAAILPGVAGEATNPANGNQYSFWRGPQGRVYEAWFATSWHGPISKGWSAGSTPSAAVTNNGHQFVVWTGRGGHIFEVADTGRWGSPRDLTAANHWGRAGTTSVSPSITVNPQTGTQYLFWRGPGNRIYEAVHTGGWSGAHSRGWTSGSAPVAAATSSGHLFVFWTAANHHIEEAWNYTGWRGPSDLSRSQGWGSTNATPGASVNPVTGHQYVFWRAGNGRIEEAWNSGRWRGPSKQRWSTTSGPSVAVSSAGNQYVLWLSGNRIWEATHLTSWTGAVGRWRLAPGPGAYAEVVQTTFSLSQRMTALSDTQFSGGTHGLRVINVNDRVHYQRLKGVGAAMTDTSAWLIHDELSPGAGAGLMRNLYTTRGIHLNFTLVPIGASDFTRTGVPYSYDDMPAGTGDPSLSHFSIGHDEAYILPVLRQMLSVSPHTETFAVPWSAPAWMKANDNLNDLGHRGSLLSSSYEPFAQYFVKFIEAYAAHGVPVQAVAPENEPRSGARFPSMYFPETDEARWIAQDLGPALRSAGLRTKVYGNDTSWQVPDYGQSLATSAARSSMNGLAWHCYGGIPSVMDGVHKVEPSLDQIITECAPNLSPYAAAEIVIGSMRHWASNVTLWNIATNPEGGPVEPPNSGCHGCRGIVTINQRTHRVSYRLDYFQLGQVGSFLQAGAYRVASNSWVNFRKVGRKSKATSGLDDLAFTNPDGSRVLVVYDNSGASIRFAVRWRGRAFTYRLPPRGMVTFRWP